MQLSAENEQYLAEKSFSTNLRTVFEFSPADKEYRSRIDILKSLSSGKKIIHAGCVDHDISNISKKISKNKWLHKILHESAERCFGVDINKEGIAYIRDTFGYTDLEAIDILECEDSRLLENYWDYILIPEVLEHCNDPVNFLKKIHDKFKKNVKGIVITVPNAFSKDNYKNAKKHTELINSDHRYWFTPFTINKIAVLAGFSVARTLMCRSGIIKKRSFLKNWYFKHHPLLRNGIVLIGFF